MHREKREGDSELKKKEGEKEIVREIERAGRLMRICVHACT
jgi:hypothetical protein